MNLRGTGRNCSHFNVKDMITPVYIYVAHPDIHSFFLFSIVDVTTMTIVAIEIIVIIVIIVTTVTSINMLPVSFVSGCI